MGLDLCPFGRPKPGHKTEWEKLMRPLYAGKRERKREGKKRESISIHSYEDVGAPRVGYDLKADRWALKNWPRQKGVSDAALLKDLHGYYVLELLQGKCDGLPKYTHASLGYGVDETTFRGQFLDGCVDLLGEELLHQAWTAYMPPDEAIRYGKKLVKIASNASASKSKGANRPRIVPVRKASAKDEQDGGRLTLSEQIDVLRSAGRWYIFWGQRGHPIFAYF